MTGAGPFKPRGEKPRPAPGPEPEPAPAGSPDPDGPAPARPSVVSSSVTWILGVAVVLALAYITLNTVSTDAPGGRGVPAGELLPAFAAPLVPDGPVGDAQVDPEKACDVRGSGVLSSCELRSSGDTVALAFVATRSERCEEQVDRLERVASSLPGVRIAAVAIRGDRADVARTARERGWRLPVAWDRDGAVANLYAVALCPTVTIAGPDGRVADTTFGLVAEAELARRIGEADDRP